MLVIENFEFLERILSRSCSDNVSCMFLMISAVQFAFYFVLFYFREETSRNLNVLWEGDFHFILLCA